MKIAHLFLAALLLLPSSCGRRGEPQARNIILVSIDTLRADHVGHYGYGRDTTPWLDGFASRSLVFTRAYADSSFTLPSHVSLMTSVYPESHGVLKLEDALSEGIETLAGILARQGYETAGFINSGWLKPKFGLDRGFGVYDYYDDLQVRQGGGQITIGRNAEETNEAVLQWLEKRAPDKPFFLFVHYFDVHSDWSRLPYDAPAPFGQKFAADYRGGFKGGESGVYASRYLLQMNEARRNFNAEDRAYIEALYDGGIAYTDHQLGLLMGHLEERGLLETSIVVVVSDHGEEFQEHGMMLHEQVYEEHVRIPLLMRFPPKRRLFGMKGEAGDPGRLIDTPVQLVDIMPTLLDYLGMEAPSLAQGRSLRPVIEGGALPPRAMYSINFTRTQYMILEDGWKLIYHIPEKRAELFDLERDIGERRDLSGEERDRTAALLESLRRWREERRRDGASIKSRKIDIDEKTRRELEALGYIK